MMSYIPLFFFKALLMLIFLWIHSRLRINVMRLVIIVNPKFFHLLFGSFVNPFDFKCWSHEREQLSQNELDFILRILKACADKIFASQRGCLVRLPIQHEFANWKYTYMFLNCKTRNSLLRRSTYIAQKLYFWTLITEFLIKKRTRQLHLY